MSKASKKRRTERYKHAHVRSRKQPRKAGGQDLLSRFAIHLTKRRKEEQLSLRGLAERAEIPFTNIFQYESLGKNPRLTELAQLAKALGEPLGKFLEPML